jgi:hypothetical protein
MAYNLEKSNGKAVQSILNCSSGVESREFKFAL